MRVYLGAALCVLSAAACAREPAKDPSTSYTEPTVTTQTDDGMRPASSDSTLTSSDGTTSTTATSEHASDGTWGANGTTTTGTTNSPATGTKTNADTPMVSPPAADKPVAVDKTVAADNTKINKRDRDAAALTPMDQGQGSGDIDITQQIRKAVMADGSLSFTAKNVKIITVGGKVTLRGPVNSAAERASIEAAARKVAGAGKVDNQLEVKP